VKTKILLLLVALLVSIALQSHAMEKGIFQPPSLEGYTLVQTKQLDKDNNGSRETTLEIYAKGKTKLIGKYITDGKVWGWAIYNDLQNRDDPFKNFSIRDSNGDGIFNEKYTTTEEYPLPDYLK